MKKKFITLSLGIFCALELSAQLPSQTVDLNTGVVNGTTTLIPVNSYDDTWTIQSPSGGAYQNVKCSTGTVNWGGTLYPSTWAHDPNVRWLSPNMDASGNATDNAAVGDFNYKMTFVASAACPVASASILFNEIGADNIIDQINVNGNDVYAGAGFNPLVSTTVTGIGGYIVPGVNTIIVSVYNMDKFTGLLIDGKLTINYGGDPNLIPTFTGNTQFCKNDPLIFVGSDGPSTATNTFWEIAAADASGNVTPGGFVWNQWFTGTPGTFTFPPAATSTLSCNAYYNIKMAVQDACVGWVQTTKTIHINCPPNVNAGADDSICKGSCAGIGTFTLTRGITYTWATTQNGNVVNAGTGPDLTVCPTTTTTYTLTTHNAAGCTSTDAVTVYVTNNDPSYSIMVNNSQPGYFTVMTYANNTNAYNDPGFVYEFRIEELSGSTSLYTDYGTDAWWTYPNNSLKGFDATAYPAGGNFTQTAWWAPAPNDGRFLYGHTYKITRGTKNNICNTYAEYPIIITPTRMLMQNGNNQKMDVLEGKDAEDFMTRMAATALENGSDELSIYPNPGDGIFTISTTNLNGGIMEVYDVRGTKIQSVEIKNTDTYSLDLSGYAKGIYMIKMNVNNKVITKKIILQ